MFDNNINRRSEQRLRSRTATVTQAQQTGTSVVGVSPATYIPWGRPMYFPLVAAAER